MYRPPSPFDDAVVRFEPTAAGVPARRGGKKLVTAARLALLAGVWLAAAGGVSADVLREQVIQMQRGWNAVHLEVGPIDADPAAVFGGKPVDIVARYFRLLSPVEFITDPTDEPWNQEGWGVWYAPSRPDAFLTSLHAIQGSQTYLVHATEPFEWRVVGKSAYSRPQWRVDSFNLVGFSVDPANPPTFGDWFAGAAGRVGSKIYRLSDGRWTKVINPASTTMRSGEAVWVWCEGLADYPGPLDLNVPASGLLDFGVINESLEVGWRSGGGLSVKVVEPAGSGGSVLPLHQVERELGTLTDSHSSLSTASFDAAAGTFTIQLRREEMSAATQGALLRITDGSGVVAWVPVTASKPAN